MEWLLIVLFAMALIFVAWKYLQLRTWAQGQERHFREEEQRIREDAIKKSEAVIRGKVTEHLMPYLPEFKYNPKDVRFIGTPVDLLVFDGLSEGEVKQIVFIEVKTGRESSTSPREKLVKDCVGKKAVSYEMIRSALAAAAS